MSSHFKKLFAFLAIFVVAVAIAVPTSASAQGYYWGPWTVTSTTNYPGNSAFGLSHNQNHDQYVKQLLALIKKLQAQLDALNDDDDDWSSDTEIEITTLSADDIEDEDATLRGEVDFNDSDYAYVWFEWGDDTNDLDEETTHIKLDDDEDEDFSAIITDLDEDEKYYFRAVGEDEDGDLDKGAIKSFTSDDEGSNSDDDDDSDEDAPEVETGDSEDVESHSAKIFGDVDMNDFENGIVFFVYGQDESQVNDIDDDFDNYNEIDEDDEDLQKIKVDGDADDSGDYSAEFWGLDDDTEYFYALCLEYEDEDNDDTIMCGDTESFTTEN